MGEIYLPSREKDALAKLKRDTLSKAVSHAIDEGQLSELSALRLPECGAYIANEYEAFQRAFTRYKAAKSYKKSEETHDDLRRAGSRLTFALDQMHRRMAQEEADSQLFRINDEIYHPYHVGIRMSVTVQYQWRKATTDEWSRGSITFEHTAEFQPDHGSPAHKRKLSAAKVREEKAEKLRREWEQLMRGALYSVQAYFREGRDGLAIPETFRVVVDDYHRCLNNHSTKFWSDKA